MTIEQFEQKLFREWAVSRTDIYNGGLVPLHELGACQPIRPDKVMERLQVSEEQLVALLAMGKLGRPGALSKERVAWRLDEVEALVSLRDPMN